MRISEKIERKTDEDISLHTHLRSASSGKSDRGMKRMMRILLCLCLTVPCLQGCVERRTKIAYTVYPVAYLIQRIAGDTIPCESIQKGNTIVQRATVRKDYERILKQSYVFFHIGNLEPYLSVFQKEISESGAEDEDLAGNNAVYDFGRYVKADEEKGITETIEPYYQGEVFDRVDTSTKDLSLWIDPIAMMSMGKDIRDWLIQKNPNEESFYSGNYRKLEDDLINLDAQYQNLASEVNQNHERIAFVSMTATFGNWQKAYGFQVYPVVLSRYGVTPDEQQLAMIEKRIRDDKVSYIVKEPNLPDDMEKLYERVRKDCSLKEMSLSNLSSLSESENKDGKDYLSIMYENLNTLKEMEEENPSS